MRVADICSTSATTPGYEQGRALIGSLLAGYHLISYECRVRGKQMYKNKPILLTKIFTLVSYNNSGVVDGQRRALPRAEVISIVFINLGRYIIHQLHRLIANSRHSHRGFQE